MGAIVGWKILGAVIIWGYQGCSGETRQNDVCQSGYSNGYYEACKAFERELPGNLDSRYDPFGCV